MSKFIDIWVFIRVDPHKVEQPPGGNVIEFARRPISDIRGYDPYAGQPDRHLPKKPIDDSNPWKGFARPSEDDDLPPF